MDGADSAIVITRSSQVAWTESHAGLPGVRKRTHVRNPVRNMTRVVSAVQGAYRGDFVEYERDSAHVIDTSSQAFAIAFNAVRNESKSNAIIAKTFRVAQPERVP